MEGVLRIEEFAKLLGASDREVPVAVARVQKFQEIKEAAQVREIAQAAPGPQATWSGWAFPGPEGAW